MARRFLTLDAMRGIAALAVVVRHGPGWFTPIPTPRAHLAVDFFFLLSGFILARVYEPRFAAGMGVRDFMKQRYIRLYPLFILGLAVGILSTSIALLMHRGTLPAGAVVVASLSEMLMLPSPTWNATTDIFPLNKPGWSLFFELAANLMYVGLWRYLRLPVLAAISAACAGVLIFYCQDGARFGGTEWPIFGWGFARVGFSFFLGVIFGKIYREKMVTTHWAAILPLTILPILFVPMLAGPVTELLIVLFVFPCIVAAGAMIEPHHARTFVTLGLLSYPVYAIHEPVLYFVWRILIFLKINPTQHAPLAGIVFLVAIAVLALWLDRVYDQPIRKYLTARLFRSSTPRETSEVVS